jgi:hypothetical protein
MNNFSNIWLKKKNLIYVKIVKGITIFIDGDTKIIRVRSKTFVGFIKIENDNQNVRWECAKGKYQWKNFSFNFLVSHNEKILQI